MKRKANFCFALVVLFLVSVFSKSISSGAADSSGVSKFSGAQSIADWWPMFHHDLTHTGNSNSTAPNTNQTLWKFNTGGQVDSPAVANGIVYVGSYDHLVYAFGPSPKGKPAQGAGITTEYVCAGIATVAIAIIAIVGYAYMKTRKK